MNFEKIKLEFETLEVTDIIASSSSIEEPTVTPTEPTTKYDPYENDKW